MAVQLRSLRGACALLEAVASAVGTAQRLEPGRADDMELLHAIPSAVLAPRRLPGKDETIARLCDGSANSADLRKAARRASEPKEGADPAGAPPGSVERQLRQLGITQPALLTRGKRLDHLNEQLMLDAAKHKSRRPASPRARPDDLSPAGPVGRREPRTVMAIGHGRDREAEALEAEP